MQELYRRSSLALLRAKKRMKADDDPTFLEGARRILDFMYNAWQDQKCCDVVIKANGGDMHAHSVAFGAYSDTLTNSFYGYSNGEVINLDLSDFRREVVLTILHFLYTTELELNCHIIGQVLSCATKLGLDVIVHMCMDYLSKVDVDNAVLHYSIAENNAMKELRDSILAFLLQQFTAVSKTKHFVYMPFERLVAIIKDESICIDNESDLFRAIVRWVDHDRTTRMQYSKELLQCVRFSLISAELLVSEVEAADWIFENQELWRECLYKAMKFNALSTKEPEIAQRLQATPRRCQLNKLHISPSGRMSGDSLSVSASTMNYVPDSMRSSCSAKNLSPTKQQSGPVFDAKKKSLSQRTSPAGSPTRLSKLQQSVSQTNPTTSPCARGSQARAGPSASLGHPGAFLAASKGNRRHYDGGSSPEPSPDEAAETEGLLVQGLSGSCMVTVGGIDLQSLDPETPGKALYGYELDSNSWSLIDAPMNNYVHHHGVAVLNKKLYVVGGALYKGSQNLGVATNDVFVFDAESREWSQTMTMTEPRAYHSCAIWRNKIYAVGGENQAKQKLDSVECLDVSKDQWVVVTRVPGGARVGAAVAVHQDGLFVVGGYNRDIHKNGILDDVAFYDLLYNSWIVLKSLAVPRCHAGLVVVQNRLFLVGGRTRRRDAGRTIVSLDGVEEYNVDTDMWSRAATMKTPRHDMGCAAIGSMLMVVGGITCPSTACITSVECFNVSSGEWVDKVQPFPHPVAGVACAALVLVDEQ